MSIRLPGIRVPDVELLKARQFCLQLFQSFRAKLRAVQIELFQVRKT